MSAGQLFVVACCFRAGFLLILLQERERVPFRSMKAINQGDDAEVSFFSTGYEWSISADHDRHHKHPKSIKKHCIVRNTSIRERVRKPSTGTEYVQTRFLTRWISVTPPRRRRLESSQKSRFGPIL